MEKFVLNPLKGAHNITFGMSQKEVRELYKNAGLEAGENCDYFYESELCVSYNHQNEVEYIEFNGPFTELVEVEILGLNFFDLKAEEFIQKMAAEKQQHFFEKDAEIPYSYIFPELELSVWREFTPEDVDFAIEEAKEMETYLEEKKELEEDLETSQYFFTIGIGHKGYYEEIYGAK